MVVSDTQRPAAVNGDGWHIVRFGDVVRQVKDSVDPESSGLARYVAGEHMGTDDLHIRSWGVIGDGYLGPAFHMRFRPGHVLYGSRRTYLRKVAFADFEGICANTTFVLEPKGDELLPELLPFIMQTESFHEYSIRQSRGSVNPYVNFRDIAAYEFALPPKDEQRRIAEILWAADAMLEHWIEVIQSVSMFRSALEEETFSHSADSQAMRTVADVLLEPPRNGLSPKVNAGDRGCPTLSIGAIRDGWVVPEGNLKYAEITSDELNSFRLVPGDVLIVRGNGNKGLVGRCGIVAEVPTDCFYPDLLIRLRFDETKIRSRFAAYQWNALPAHSTLLRRAKSTNGIWKINGRDIRQHNLVVPNMTEQDRVVGMFDDLERDSKAAQAHLSSVMGVRGALSRRLLGAGDRV